MTRTPSLALVTLLAVVLTAVAFVVGSAEPGHAEDYREPPAVVKRIVDAPPSPSFALDPTGTRALLVARTSHPPVADLARPLWRLGGYRLDPSTNGRHGPRSSVGLTILEIAERWERPITLPDDADIGSPVWNKDGTMVAFTLTTEDGIALWVADATTARARRLTDPSLNAALGAAFRWMPDGRRLICAFVDPEREDAPEPPREPEGPVIQESTGRKAPVRTYQDLLRNETDARRFEWIGTSQPALVDARSGERRDLPHLPPAIYRRLDPSPDGQWLLVSRTTRPFSYSVPAYRFPEVIATVRLDGQERVEIAKPGLREEIPIGGVETGARGFRWRPDRDATLLYLEALDGGDPKREVEHRDRLVARDAPFRGTPREIYRTEHRFRGIDFLASGRGQVLIGEYDRDRRWTRTWLTHIDERGDEPRLVWDRSVQDRYGDPGRAMQTLDARGRTVLRVEDGALLLTGSGATPDGDRPFLDRLDLATLTTERVWVCEGERYETVAGLLGDGTLLTRHETRTEPPNYWARDLESGEREPITRFVDPAPELAGVEGELVTYERDDGVPLSATLYLPPGHQEGERLPLVVWAYPLEYNDRSTAGQVRGSPYRFTRPRGTSHLFLLTQGYAVMDRAAMPVIGDPETVNDTFVKQIVGSAQAAIDFAVERGVADRDRVAVGGHSYGAFMTANLLAHCDLFRAGIARSGAYNRTLTPFGFQSERRTFWEAKDTYFKVSPFMHADRIDEPMLMIHGEIDNNSGTFPMQSRRMYHAIKGNGGHARLVMLPHESHGYRGRESVLHVLAEMIDWLDEHVKNAKPRPAPEAKPAPETTPAPEPKKPVRQAW